VVDFQKGFTDPRFRMGKSPRIHAARDRTADLLDVARRCNIPVASCYVGWQSKKDLQYWKVAAVQEDFFDGSEAQDVDPKIADPSYDFIFKKCAPSIFFQTPIMPFLTKQRIDTVIVTGCVTSGCIRASTIDAFSYGYRTIVVDDCCGDPMQESHEANLKDMGRRYADIKQSADVLDYFEQVRGKNA
jgi:maleamate amidohydrolase